MDKVYVVTDEHDDYDVLGVFSSLDKAEEFKQQYHLSSEVEIHEVDKFHGMEFNLYHMTMDYEGNIDFRYDIFGRSLDNCLKNLEICETKFYYAWEDDELKNSLWIQGRIKARSKQDAIKIARKEHVRILDSGEWEDKKERLKVEKEERIGAFSLLRERYAAQNGGDEPDFLPDDVPISNEAIERLFSDSAQTHKIKERGLE